MFRCGEAKIGQAIVDKIDGRGPEPKFAVPIGKVAWRGDDCIDPIPTEQTLEENKFWIEVLRAGIGVDDRDPRQRRAAALAAIFSAKTLEDGSFKAVHFAAFWHEGFNCSAARSLSACDEGVDQCASSVRVDLDEFGAVFT